MENPSLALCFYVTTGYGRYLSEPQFPTCAIGLVLRACAFIGCYETSWRLVHSACSVNWSCSLMLPGVYLAGLSVGALFPTLHLANSYTADRSQLRYPFLWEALPCSLVGQRSFLVLTSP